MNMQEVTTVPAPSAPRSIEAMQMPLTMLRDILIKTLFRKNVSFLSDIARAVCLPIPVTQELIDVVRSQRLCEAMGTLNANSGNEMGYQLTESGRARALDALGQSEYFGAMPVPLDVYRQQVRLQTIRNIQLSRDALNGAMSHLVLPRPLMDQLGPAVNAGRSILLYGPPGNGKSSISRGIGDALGDRIYVPRAIEYAGQVITLFDPTVHTAVDDEIEDTLSLRRTTGRHDTRYVRCKRPAVITGGELTLSMLDLVFNGVARTYQAPLQLKATGGVFIVDDLGRQKESPQSIVNRWIVPLEEGRDILSLQSGEKFEVPFDTLVIFSTNFQPSEIFDRAALRRLFFKIRIDGPNREDFLKIFAIAARKKKLPLNQEALLHLLNTKYPTIENEFANYHPVFLIDQMLAICDFEGIPHQMNPALIDRAWENLFVRDGKVPR